MTKKVHIAKGDSQTAAILCQLIRMVKEFCLGLHGIELGLI